MTFSADPQHESKDVHIFFFGKGIALACVFLSLHIVVLLVVTMLKYLWWDAGHDLDDHPICWCFFYAHVSVLSFRRCLRISGAPLGLSRSTPLLICPLGWSLVAFNSTVTFGHFPC